MVVPGSIFGFVVTSWDDDFLGIRNNEFTEGCGIGLFAVPVDGLVSLEARRGGDVTDCLFVFAPDGIERARCLSASLSEELILFDDGPDVVVVVVTADDDADVED